MAGLTHTRREIEAAWRAFLVKGEVPRSVKPEILRSWQRARAEWRVDPTLRTCPAIPSASEVLESSAEDEAFRLAAPTISEFAARLAPDGHVVAYFDARGVLLAIDGHHVTRSRLADVNFAPGACWAESCAGTNGIGTALVEERSVEVFASEHFVEAWQPWTCASVPVRCGEAVVGVVDITSPWTAYHPMLLAMAESVARTVEAKLEVAAARRQAALAAAVAGDALRAREQLFAVASHELKTPLTPLQLKMQRVARLLERGGASPPLDKIVEVLRGADEHVRRVVASVDEIVEASRVDERVALRPQPTHLGEVVWRVLRRRGSELRRHGCTVSVTTVRRGSGFWDRAQLERAFEHVLLNAMTYAPGRIEVELDADARGARLCVRDHGPGIAPADLQRIFLPFERAVSYRNLAGLGVGLHVARGILEAHGGSISVDSELGRGTTFVLELPATPDAH